MKSIIDNVTDHEFAILEKILHRPGHTPADFFFEDPTIDGRIQMLLEHQLISMSSEHKLSITELGRAALVEHNVMQKIQKKQNQFQLIQFWVPTIISLAALAVSIIALTQ